MTKETVKITTLIENNIDEKHLCSPEHGLSILIQCYGKKLLFDTGQSGKFIENASVLGKDLEDIDYVILSHGHYDHSGGYTRFLKEIKNPPELIVGEGFFEKKYKTDDEKKEKFIGNNFDEDFLKEKGIKYTKIKDNKYELFNDIYIFKGFENSNPYEEPNKKFYLKEKKSIKTDDFMDEIAVGIMTSKGMIVILGCSHPGVINILENIKERANINICGIIGGTHLVDCDKERLEFTVKKIKQLDPQFIAVSHCTGDVAVECLKKEFGEKFIYNNTGNIIEI